MDELSVAGYRISQRARKQNDSGEINPNETEPEILKQFVISFSGGKDSTAMLLLMLEKNEPIHSVMWFDTERDFPEILRHIEKIKTISIIRFVRIRHWIGFDFLEARYKKPHPSGGWCAAAKRDCCNKYMRLIKKDNPEIIECIGFNANEKKRADKIFKSWPVRFPLIEAGMSGADALQFCYKHNYDFGGIYDWMPSGRVSCYDCPKQSKADLAAIKKHYPEGVDRP